LELAQLTLMTCSSWVTGAPIRISTSSCPMAPVFTTRVALREPVTRMQCTSTRQRIPSTMERRSHIRRDLGAALERWVHAQLSCRAQYSRAGSLSQHDRPLRKFACADPGWYWEPPEDHIAQWPLDCLYV